jgi:hypothetical protein
MPMNDDDDFAEFDADDPDQQAFEIWLNDPEAQKEYKRYLADSAEAEKRLGRILDRFKELDGLPKDLLLDIKLLLINYQRSLIEEKRRSIQDARRDDVDRRRGLALKVIDEIQAARPEMPDRSLANLVHSRLANDPNLSPSEVLGVEAIRKILREQRGSS